MPQPKDTAEWTPKQNLYITCLKETHFRPIDTQMESRQHHESQPLCQSQYNGDCMQAAPLGKMNPDKQSEDSMLPHFPSPSQEKINKVSFGTG